VVLVLVAAWDVIGLMFGDRLYASPSYDLLRSMAQQVQVAGFVPGMRIYGAGLAVIGAVLTWTLLRQKVSGEVSWRLRLALSGLAAWWASWCVGIALSFFANGEVHAWGALGKLLGIAAVAVIAARVPPPSAEHDQRMTGG
jgi:hypothetical protein